MPDTDTIRLSGETAFLTTGRHAGMRHALFGTYMVLERDRWGSPRIVRSTISLEEWELTR
jgi:hypothetical protein